MTTTPTPLPGARAIAAMKPELERQQQAFFEQGCQDCRNNQHENPFPYRSLAYFAWMRGHDSISCDECGGQRRVLQCPQCKSDDVESWEYYRGMDAETGYQDAGMLAKCAACHFKGDVDEFEIPCVHCSGSGIEPGTDERRKAPGRETVSVQEVA